MLKLLKAVFNLIDVKPEDVLSVDKKYKVLLKPLRIKLKSLHPDEGGNANDFDKAYNVYEALLKQSKQDNKEAALVSNLRTYIKCSQQQLDNLDNFDFILNEIKKPQKYFGVLLDDLVEHFNRLKYCQLFEPNDITRDTTQAVIHLQCGEQIQGVTHRSNLIETRNLAYSPTGQYKADLALGLNGPAELKISLRGFETPIIKNITHSGIYNIEFEENFVRFKLELTIELKTD